jgi:hypothetical protein
LLVLIHAAKQHFKGDLQMAKATKASKATKSLTQNQFLVSHLRGTGKELTVAEAKEKYSIGNLRARIAELRQAGLVVSTRKTTTGAASYKIATRLQNGSRAKVAI